MNRIWKFPNAVISQINKNNGHYLDKKRLMRFVSKYLGEEGQNWNPWFIENVVDPLDAMIEIMPESIVAKNVSFFKTGPDLAS